MDKITICELVRQAEQDYTTAITKNSKYVEFSMYETLNKIDAYLNSKHISGEVDYMGREKPFFNIVTAAVNVWYRATDLDQKDIKIRATKESDILESFLATVKVREWMRKNNFGVFLNNWGRTLSRYGSCVSKFVEKEGKLICEVVPWNRIICDSIDFYSNPVIEKFFLTPAQLQRRIKTHNYDKDFVNQIIEKQSLTTRTTWDKQSKDTKDDYIPIYEIHGELPLSMLTDEDDDTDTFEQQVHVVTFIESKEKGDVFDEYTLYAGKEAKLPYQKDDLIAEDGRTLAIGAVEHLFEAQWMMNHNAKEIKDQLDFCSKVITQTSDANFTGRNVLNSVETGQILVHAPNQPLTRINNQADISALQAYGQQWKALGMEINGINEAMTQAPKSGTAWRQTQAILQEAHSLFELMAENKGLSLKEMFTSFILPHIKKQMDTTKEISEILSDYEIKQIDSRFVPAEAIRRINSRIKNRILSVTPEDIANGNLFDPGTQSGMVSQEMDKIQAELTGMGNQRFIKPDEIDSKTWKEVFKDLEWDLEVDITGEQRDAQGAMETLTNVFQTVANPATAQVLQTPEGKLIFNKIMEIAGGISPLELSSMPKQPVVQQAPQGAQVGGGQMA